MSDEEQRLSALLEQAVPHLPAPAQRWERVRERVRRRRRRRAAGMSAAAVVALAAAGLLLPGLAGPSGAPRPSPGVTSLAPPASDGAPALSGPSTGPSTGPPAPPRLFADLAGLRLMLPPGWHTIKPPGLDEEYVSSQAPALPPGDCAQPLDDFCTPLARRLDRGGVLIQLKLEHNQGMADKVRLRGWTVYPAPVVQACRTVEGTDELAALLPGDSRSDVLVEATACLSRPTAAQKARIRALLTTAGFS